MVSEQRGFGCSFSSDLSCGVAQAVQTLSGSSKLFRLLDTLWRIIGSAAHAFTNTPNFAFASEGQLSRMDFVDRLSGRARHFDSNAVFKFTDL